MIDSSYPSDNPTKDSHPTWENDPHERVLNALLSQSPNSLLKDSTEKNKARRSDMVPNTISKEKIKGHLDYFSKEKLQALSAQDLKEFQKKKIKYVNSFSLSSSYLPEGFNQKTIGNALGSIRYCEKMDLQSIMNKRIKGTNFYKLRKTILHSMKSVTKLIRADNYLDRSVVKTQSIKTLAQSVPDDLSIQKELQCLVLDTLFPNENRQVNKKQGKRMTHRPINKILESKVLRSLTIRKENVKNLLQKQQEISTLLEKLPGLKEFTLGIDFGYNTFWNPQLSLDIASRITSFNMRYKSSHLHDPKSPLFDFLNNIEAFKNLRSFRYEESDGKHWRNSQALKAISVLEKFKTIPLKDFYINLFFGMQDNYVERAIRGFFNHLSLPDTLENFVFYARLDNLVVFRPIQESFPSFQNLNTLHNLKSFDLSIIANVLVSYPTAKEEEVGLLFQFFMSTLNQLHPHLEQLSLGVIKNTVCSVQKKYQDEELLSIISNRFQNLKNLSLEFPDKSVELFWPSHDIILSKLEKLSITGSNFPIDFCKKLSPKALYELNYIAPKTIELENVIECLEGVSNLNGLTNVNLMFPGYEKYDMRKEILDGIVKVFQRLENLTEFCIYIDVRSKTGTLDWLLDLANAKKSLRLCKFNFYHYGAVMPNLIMKEDVWIKHYLEKTRKFLTV